MQVHDPVDIPAEGRAGATYSRGGSDQRLVTTSQSFRSKFVVTMRIEVRVREEAEYRVVEDIRRAATVADLGHALIDQVASGGHSAEVSVELLEAPER